ncbi:NifB/NifX family molybdenum-iron cluster-binding protein [bacterium]|nr:NifB/NifX family molybdenum-iron cluster-binding protein [bacterium]
MKIAIPLAQGKLTSHFGHCEVFAVLDVDEAKKCISSKEQLAPPAHEPGVLPAWLHELGVDVIIAGGMGNRAQTLFVEKGIKVVVGAPPETPEDLVMQYLDQTLRTGANYCDH